MYPSVIIQDFNAKVLKALGNEPQMSAVAKAWGYANPVEMVKRIYSFSRNTLWAGNDIIMMQAFLEKEAMQAKNVIKDVEKHIPNYHVRDQVMESRLISEALRSPVVVAFGRYDYGRMASYGHMITDLIAKDSTIKERAKALDQMAMVAFMGLVVYPIILDRVAKALTGNENASVQRFGSATVPYLLYEYFYKDKNLSQVINSITPMAPALQTGVAMWNNRDLFTGKHLIEQPADVSSTVAKLISPLGTAARIEEGKMSAGQFALSAIGVKSPTNEQLAKAARAKAIENAQNARRLAR
jgi:hypothetical protein